MKIKQHQRTIKQHQQKQQLKLTTSNTIKSKPHTTSYKNQTSSNNIKQHLTPIKQPTEKSKESNTNQAKSNNIDTKQLKSNEI